MPTLINEFRFYVELQIIPTLKTFLLITSKYLQDSFSSFRSNYYFMRRNYCRWSISELRSVVGNNNEFWEAHKSNRCACYWIDSDTVSKTIVILHICLCLITFIWEFNDVSLITYIIVDEWIWVFKMKFKLSVRELTSLVINNNKTLKGILVWKEWLIFYCRL